MNKYIVINSEDIQKRIEKLKLDKEEMQGRVPQIYFDSLIKELENILSKSKPLTPIIEDVFEAGELLGKGFKVKTKQDYINNLKLDI